MCLSAQSFTPNGSGGGAVDLLGTNFPSNAVPLVLGMVSQNLANGVNGSPFAAPPPCTTCIFTKPSSATWGRWH